MQFKRHGLRVWTDRDDIVSINGLRSDHWSTDFHFTSKKAQVQFYTALKSTKSKADLLALLAEQRKFPGSLL